MNFLSIPTSLSKNPRVKENKLTRDFSFTNLTNFKNDLGSLAWNEVLLLNDVDLSFDTFWDVFNTLFNLHFPLTKFNFNKNKHSKNDFMTAGLLISRAHKLELHKKSLIDPAQFSNRYKEYRNIFNSLIRASKKLHYDAKFSLHANNPKKIWNLLNEISGVKKVCNGTNIPYIEVNGNTINSPQDIANEFNSFFVTAGKNISDNVPPSSRTPESYFLLTDDPPPEFNLGNINAQHIRDIVKSFPNKQSTDIDGLSLKLLKFVSNEVCVPLAHIFDLSFTTGIFPSKLKTNRTVPIFKAGDPSSCDNYRPISLIPTLSKILEKIVAINLTNHLQLNNLLHKNQFGFQRNTSTEHNLLKVFNLYRGFSQQGKLLHWCLSRSQKSL
jgi:potassium voltage-gated channel Eag-related subfamily H protein 8